MNPTLFQAFHWYTEGNGTFYKNLQESVPLLSELGISMAWLPPAFKGAYGGYSVGYDPYDLYDLGEFDQKGSVATKYGTKEAYLAACKALQEAGIAVMADIVLNHKAHGDQKERFMAVRVNPENRKDAESEPVEIESYTRFTFPGRNNVYSDFQWDFTCFSGVDHAENHEGIFRILHDHGEGWEEMVGDEKGNYDYLMFNDIEHRNPFVREELNAWGKWYHDQIGFDGVRLDAVKHQSPDFYREWLTLLRSNTGKNIFAVGEYWNAGQLELLEEYIAVIQGSMSLFDAPLQRHFHEASRQGAAYDLRNIFRGTLTEKNPMLSVTVVANHDTQPLQELESGVENWFKPLAYALILLRESGLPCVFYPDLYGAQYRDAGEDGLEHEIFMQKTEKIEELLKVRKLFAYGFQRDYFEDANCLGWTREGDENHAGCAVVLSNRDAYEKPMEMGMPYAGQHFYDYLQRFDHEVEIDENGWGNFPVPAGNVSVWVPVSAIESGV